MLIHDILGIDSASGYSAVESGYTNSKIALQKDRFLPGAAGTTAAKQLDALESAWRDYVDSTIVTNDRQEPDFAAVDRAVQSGNLDLAQQLLDNIPIRQAEWNYFQALVFYKRDWLTQSRKHLVMATEQDPSNLKYRDTLSKLDQQLGNGSANPNGFGNNNYQQGYNQGRDNAMRDCCLMYCITELCLSCCLH